ncbi:MAG: hypothetical protein HFJ55_00820 [Clostridia bacterium]|nr:hypothetical protein [Clostridia bacterium]
MVGSTLGNMQFGLNQAEDIASTPIGIAVRIGENWRLYDIIKNKVIDVKEPDFDNMPTFIIPSVRLRVGDLIKDNDEYYFVVGAGLGITRVQSTRTDEVKTELPTRNFLGTNCYLKIVTFDELIEMDSANSHEENLATIPSDNVQTLLEMRRNIFKVMNSGEIEPEKIKWLTD